MSESADDEKPLLRHALSGLIYQPGYCRCLSLPLGLWRWCYDSISNLSWLLWDHHVPAADEQVTNISISTAYLACLSMILSFILAVVQLIIWIEEDGSPGHLTHFGMTRIRQRATLSVPFCRILFPTSMWIRQQFRLKDFIFPLAEELQLLFRRTKALIPEAWH